MSYRLRSQERNFSGFVTQSQDATAGMPVVCKKGLGPYLLQSDKDVITYLDNPDSTYWGVFEVIEYARVAPVIAVPVLGNNYAHGGVDVYTDGVVAFGSGAGRNLANFKADAETQYQSVELPASYTMSVSGDGLTKSFSGTITPSSVLPITASSVVLKVGGVAVSASVSGSVISGTAIDGAGTYNTTTGAYSFDFSGTVGTVAELLTTIDGSSGYDLSSGGTNKKVNIQIDKVTYQNVNLGSAGISLKADIITRINDAVGYTAASSSGNYINIVGRKGSAAQGNVKITDPSDGSASALNLVFDLNADGTTGFSQTTDAVSPTGSIPLAGQSVSTSFTYSADVSSTVAFSVFLKSPHDDDVDPIAISVARYGTSGKQYTLKLYEVVNNQNSLVKSVIFSLIREKDNFGRSLYYEDIFRNDSRIEIVVNPGFAGTADPVEEAIAVTGGDRGDDPVLSNYQTAWSYFQQRNKYRIKLAVDIYGNSASFVSSIVNSYQPQAFGLSVIPYGYNVIDSVSFRNGLGLDDDNMALYSNWMRIEDPYNSSTAWISGMGKTAVKYAQTATVYDGLPPAGPDDNGIGGQLSGFTILEMEWDYSDQETGSDLQTLNEAQINPRVFDPEDGPMNYGNRTLQIANSDTSFIHTRRIYNYIIDNVSRQILKKQEFKLNDAIHRLLADSQTRSFLRPIVTGGYLNDAEVVCDESNNDSDVLDQREFILDIYVKAATSSEFVILRLTRLSQGAVVADFLAS